MAKPNTPSPSAAQRDAALGRLARSDVVALSDIGQAKNYSMVENAAVQRLITQNLSSDATADMHYGMMLKLLQDARLTISLKAPNWFYSENKSKDYGNFWERGVSGASSDAAKRDAAENSIYGYSKSATTTDPKEKEAQQRILKLGVLPSADFQPAMRPRYAAVDFAFCTNGALSKYGRSFFILRDYLKHSSTYTHCDSFEVDMDLMARRAEYGGITGKLSDTVTTYFQLGKIILFCHPKILKKLHDYALKKRVAGAEENILGGQIYIEAQMHADVVFNKDVKALCISARDLQVGPIPHPKFYNRIGSKKVWDQADARRVLKNAKAFAKRNRIEFRSVP